MVSKKTLLVYQRATETTKQRLGINEKQISFHLDEPRPRAQQRLAKAVRRLAICLGEVRGKVHSKNTQYTQISFNMDDPLIL